VGEKKMKMLSPSAIFINSMAEAIDPDGSTTIETAQPNSSQSSPFSVFLFNVSSPLFFIIVFFVTVVFKQALCLGLFVNPDDVYFSTNRSRSILVKFRF
jgi:hypothetical protein